MTLLDFLRRLLGRRTPPSASTARERLQLVLAHDRSDLNPELLEQMRREILEVVQRYVEIDLDGGDVTLETADRVTTLVANLPIKRARAVAAPPAPEAAAGGDPADQDPPPASDSGDGDGAAASSATSPPEATPRVEPFPIDAGDSAPIPAWVSPPAPPPPSEAS